MEVLDVSAQRPWLVNADENVYDYVCLLMSKASITTGASADVKQEPVSLPTSCIYDCKQVKPIRCLHDLSVQLPCTHEQLMQLELPLWGQFAAGHPL